MERVLGSLIRWLKYFSNAADFQQLQDDIVGGTDLAMDKTRAKINKKNKNDDLQMSGKSHKGSRGSSPCSGNSGSTITNKDGSTTICP